MFPVSTILFSKQFGNEIASVLLIRLKNVICFKGNFKKTSQIFQKTTSNNYKKKSQLAQRDLCICVL
jgi:hypothetical protein